MGNANECQPAWGRQWGITEPSPTACSKSQHAWLQWPVHSHQNEDASLVSEMAGSWRAAVFHESANVVVFWMVQLHLLLICFYRKTLSQFSCEMCRGTPSIGSIPPCSCYVSHRGRSIERWMTGDRTAPSLDRAVFLFETVRKHTHWMDCWATFKIINVGFQQILNMKCWLVRKLCNNK